MIKGLSSAAGFSDRTAQDLALTDAIVRELSARLISAGYVAAGPPIVEPAEPFLETSGEDLRRRLFMVEDASAQDLCLRPDLTIPLARLKLRQKLTGPQRLFAVGPVFRSQSGTGRPSETLQASAESYGSADPIGEEARLLAFAADAAGTFLAGRWAGIIGDVGLVMAAGAAAGLTPADLRLFHRALAAGRDPLAALADHVDRAKRTAATAIAPGSTDVAEIAAAVETLWDAHGLAATPARNALDVAARLADARIIAAQPPLNADSRARLIAFLQIETSLPEASDALHQAWGGSSNGLAGALAAFDRRLALMAEGGVDGARWRFRASFVRPLAYYGGLVFEVGLRGDDAMGPVIAGGRYDELLTALGGPAGEAALGAAFWPERFVAAGASHV